MNLEALLSDRLAAAFAAVAGGDVDPAVRRSQHADFQSGAALPLARRLGRAPREIAAEAVARADLAGVAVAEVSGPGFVNLTVADELIADLTNTVAADPRLGVPVTAKPETVVVDYSSPNVAKEMHVGHLRSTVIGDAAARLLEWQGHTVIRANHLGDWGTPFGMLIEHLVDLGDTGEGSLADLTAFYQAARVKFDADPEFKRRAQQRVVALQSGDPQTLALWRRLVAASERYFLAVYDLLGVSLTATDFAGESSYHDQLDSVVAELDGKGLLRVSDGALCAFPAGFTGRDGEPLPLIVRKGDGGYGYAATDLAAVRHRVRTLGASRMLYLVGTPQRTHFQMVFAVAREAGWLPGGVSAEHVEFGSILGPDGRMLKTRAGGTVKLAELLDEAVQRASALAAAKTPGLEPAALARVGRQVGTGAIKYADLSTDRRSDYVFDWDRMLALTGNTGPYLQYAYARISSIFRRAGAAAAPGPVAVTEAAERALALELIGFAPVLAEAGRSLDFHRLTGYLYGLATAFSAFYEKCPVLSAPPQMRASRLALCDLTARTLRQGLDLLGIATPDRL
ncbi:arginyl-tRNA synthetase [Krasilnikovia cinnamomea]|uniref:Arginine--tRNA ligase n=1 Tax=Krasilnikovia cinnamomea TaxID=349313 RepID=A0A4Q7ZQQ8_9ACTN|nr:arginine--tRNA ligase [Krasilnikovia cinnamomea]RZU52719.1 arginyl-tRNA synthetase [Krasilnikovia cinnamomea]